MWSHAPIPTPATKGGNLGRRGEELVLNTNPARKSPGTALGKQMRDPGIENRAWGTSRSPGNWINVFCRVAQSRVTGLVGGSVISFWIKKLLPDILSLDQGRGEDGNDTPIVQLLL